MMQAPTHRSVRVERRPLHPRAVGRRAWAFPVPADPEPVRMQTGGPAPLPSCRPLLAEIRDLFRRSPERCPKVLYDARV